MLFNLEQFKDYVFSQIEDYPKNWRTGQKVFNYIDEYYDIARVVQFEDNIDCFYKDENIEPFLEACYERIFRNDQD